MIESRATHIALAAVLSLALLLSLVFYTGFGSGDDRQYILTGYKMATGQTVGSHLGHVRLAMTVPCMILLKLSGNNLFAVTMFFAIFFLLLVYGTYKLGLVCGVPPTASVCAAFLVAVCPLLVQFSTVVMPDLPLACYITYSVLFAVKAGTVDPASRKGLVVKLGWVALSSVFLVLAYLTKMSALLALPPVLLILLVDWFLDKPRRTRVILSQLVIFCVIPVIALVLEFHIIEVLTGVGQLRFSLMQSTFTDNPRVVEQLLSVPSAAIERLGLVVTRSQVLGSWRWLVLAAAVLYPLLRNRKWRVYLVFAWFFAYLTWGSIRLTEYVPGALPARYYTIALPFAFLMTGTLLRSLFLTVWRVVPRGPLRRLTVATMFGVLLVATVWSYPKMAMPYTDFKLAEIHATSKALNLLPSDRPVILSAFLSIRLEPLFFKGRSEQLILTDQRTQVEDIGQCLEIPGGCYYIEAEREVAKFRHYQYDNVIDRMVDAKLAGSDDSDPRFDVEELLSVPSYSSRIDAMMREWAPLAFRSIKRQAYDPTAPKVLIRRIVRSRSEPSTPDLKTDLIPEWHRPGSETILKWWRISSKFGDKFTLAKSASGVAELRLSFEPSEYLWLSPKADGGDPPRFKLPAHERCVIITEVDMSETIRADLLVRFSGPADSERRIELKNGRRSIEVETGNSEVLFSPHFKIFGSGQFQLRGFWHACGALGDRE